MKKQKGFTLIELLIVVAIIGIIAAIAIPNLLSAIQRAKQKRAMSEVRSIATAVQSYATDTNVFPTAAAGAASAAAVASYLTPDYIKQVPNPDPWNTAYQYAGSANYFDVGSLGKDNVAEGADWTSAAANSNYATIIHTTCFECDICWQGDTFVVIPDGPQHTCQ